MALVRNKRYSTHLACPQCGKLLEIRPRRAKVHSHRVADDDRDLGTRMVCGVVEHRFEHVTTLGCRACGLEYSPAQCIEYDERVQPPPHDLLVEDGVVTGALAARLADLIVEGIETGDEVYGPTPLDAVHSILDNERRRRERECR